MIDRGHALRPDAATQQVNELVGAGGVWNLDIERNLRRVTQQPLAQRRLADLGFADAAGAGDMGANHGGVCAAVEECHHLRHFGGSAEQAAFARQQPVVLCVTQAGGQAGSGGIGRLGRAAELHRRRWHARHGGRSARLRHRGRSGSFRAVFDEPHQGDVNVVRSGLRLGN